MCHRTGKYTVCCASFSPDVLQTGTVKGLMAQLWRGHPQLMFPNKEIQGRTCPKMLRYVLGKIFSDEIIILDLENK